MSGHAQSLNEKGIVITGAASGIGRLTAMTLARRNSVKLFLIDVNEEVANVAHTCNLIADVNGHEPRVSYAVCSVTDRKRVQEVIDDAAHKMGGIDIVFANAGIGRAVSLERDGDMEIADLTLDINFRGVRYTVDACRSHLVKSGGYALVNASMGAIVILPLMGMAYGPSKAAAAVFGHATNLHFAGTDAVCGVLFLSEHNTPMENEFSSPLVRQLFRDNPRLRKGHKKRDPRKAVAAVIKAMEERPLNVHAPRYTVLARYFPAIPNWFVRKYLVQDMRGTLQFARGQGMNRTIE